MVQKDRNSNGGMTMAEVEVKECAGCGEVKPVVVRVKSFDGYEDFPCCSTKCADSLDPETFKDNDSPAERAIKMFLQCDVVKGHDDVTHEDYVAHDYDPTCAVCFGRKVLADMNRK
jgi:hypothetical protein